MSLDIESIDSAAQAYYGPDASERARAATHLETVVGQSLTTLAAALESTQSPYTIMYTCLTLLTTFKSQSKSMDTQQVEQLMHVVLQTIASRTTPQPTKDEASTLRSIQTLLARLSKLVMEGQGASVCFVVQRCTMEPAATLPLSGANCARTLAAVRTMSALVSELCLYDSSRSNMFMNFAQHRRASTTFRDHSLLPILRFAAELVSRVDASSEPAIIDGVTELIRQVLNYDFMAIILDETEETYVSQFPNEWRDVLCSQALLEALTKQHATLPPPYCTTLLRAVIGPIGARRSLFENQEERTTWMECFMQQTMAATSAQDDRLSRPEYCLALAEAIARFIPPHSYKDLISCRCAAAWFSFVAEFTLTVFGIPFGQGGSFATTSTLMAFWSRMVSSKKLNIEPSELSLDIETFLPTLVQTFIKNRISIPDEDLDEDALDSIQQQSDQFPSLLTLCLGPCVTQFTREITECGAERICSAPSTLMWLCYLAGSLVRLHFPNVSDELGPCYIDFLNAVLTCLSQYEQSSSRGMDGNVERSVVHFLDALQHVFASVRLTGNLAKIIEGTFQEKIKMFQFILNAVGANMLSTTLQPQVIGLSIDLIVNSCRDLPSAHLQQLTLNLPPLAELPLANHERTYKLRTKLVTALYVVKMYDIFRPAVLLEFLAPFDSAMQQIATALQPGSSVSPPTLFVAGWLRDLRGVCIATGSSETSFSEFLDWILERQEVFLAVAKAVRGPALLSSFMKFLLQLVSPPPHHSKVQVPGSHHNPAGIYLFQFVATMAQSVLSGLEGPTLTTGTDLPIELYPTALKPLAVAMDICRRCVTGEFCPFGAMQLYGDTKFEDTVVGIIRMLRVYPADVFRQFPKVHLAFNALLRAIIEHKVYVPLTHMTYEELLFVIDYAMQSAENVDEKSMVLSGSLTVLSFFASIFGDIRRQRNGLSTMGSPSSPSRALRCSVEVIAKTMSEGGADDSIFQRIVVAAMSVVNLQDRCLSNASSCVFPIFEADPQMWEQYSQHLVASHPAEKQEKVSALLRELGSGVTTADKFFTNIISFRMGMRGI